MTSPNSFIAKTSSGELSSLLMILHPPTCNLLSRYEQYTIGLTAQVLYSNPVFTPAGNSPPTKNLNSSYPNSAALSTVNSSYPPTPSSIYSTPSIKLTPASGCLFAVSSICRYVFSASSWSRAATSSWGGAW